jgi:hypothetical protein
VPLWYFRSIALWSPFLVDSESYLYSYIPIVIMCSEFQVVCFGD